MSVLPHYAELCCLSNFSFLRGASWPEELVERAKALGYAALAITDECSMAGVVRAHVAAKEHGLKLLIGSQFRVQGETPFTLIALACHLEGYGNLCEFITRLRRRSSKGSYALSLEDINGQPCCYVSRHTNQSREVLVIQTCFSCYPRAQKF